TSPVPDGNSRTFVPLTDGVPGGTVSRDDTAQPSSRGSTASMSRRARPLVLVVEDDPANRVLLSRRLARAGYDSFAVGTGPEGLEAALEGEPDLLLLDVELPGLDGFEICRRLRADPRTVALPVILLTG